MSEPTKQLKQATVAEDGTIGEGDFAVLGETISFSDGAGNWFSCTGEDWIKMFHRCQELESRNADLQYLAMAAISTASVRYSK